MVLFVNGCVRENSRTLELAKAVLSIEEDEVTEVSLYPDGPDGLNAESLRLRDELAARKNYDAPVFQWARQFAKADAIVIAAPYWDLLFPAKVRAYLEMVTVSGLTFCYGEDGIPRGLCRAKRLIYVTTAGGPIIRNLGFEYVEALAKGFYGIRDVRMVSAQGLDIRGNDPEGIMEAARQEVLLHRP